MVSAEQVKAMAAGVTTHLLQSDFVFVSQLLMMSLVVTAVFRNLLFWARPGNNDARDGVMGRLRRVQTANSLIMR